MSEVPQSKWYHSVWAVLLGLFVVLGFLALPALWRSPRFSRVAKVVLTLATLAYTIWLLNLVYGSMRTMMHEATPLGLSG